MTGMGINELYLLVPINIFFLIIFYKSKFPRYIFLFLIIALSYSYIDMADYEGYSQMYDAPNGNLSGEYFLEQTDIGFRIFVYLGNYLNLEYNLFKSIVYFIFSIFLIKGLVKISDKSANLVLSLYLFYPLILDLVQIRHFMAMATFIYTISFYLVLIQKKEVKIKNYILFIPTLLFHYSFVYLVLLVFISNKLLSQLRGRNFVVKNILLVIISFIFVSVILFFFKVSNLTYFSSETSINTKLFYLFVYLLFYLIFILVRRSIKSYNNIYDFVLIYTSLLIGTTLPLLFYNVEFFRFFRVELLILITLMFSVKLSSTKIVDLFSIILIFALHVILSIIVFYIYYLENLIFPLLIMNSQ